MFSQKIGQVDSSDLASIQQMIQPASQGNIVEVMPKFVSLHMITSATAYLFDETDNTYQPILLAQTGSISSLVNTSVEAQAILTWLNSLEWEWDHSFMTPHILIGLDAN